MRKMLTRDRVGAEPERVLAWIDPKPVAASSIGQVYRAQTREGSLVAVKVQYRGIAEVVEADMRNVRALLPLLRRLLPNLNVKELFSELRERIAEECDYELKAANHRRSARYRQGHPFVLVPAVETDLARRCVLVTEWGE